MAQLTKIIIGSGVSPVRHWAFIWNKDLLVFWRVCLGFMHQELVVFATTNHQQNDVQLFYVTLFRLMVILLVIVNNIFAIFLGHMHTR